MTGKEVVVITRPNTRSNLEVVKPQIFDGAKSKISEFLIAYKLFIRMRMREVAVKKINLVGVIIYTRKISKYLKRKCYKRSGEWKIKICDCREIFDRSEKRV